MPETDGSSKSPARAAFASGRIGRNPETDWLAGAAVQIIPCSASVSLLTGNFTGNSPKLRPRATSETPICTQGAEFSSKFPSNKNRELFLTSREFRGSNRDVRSAPKADMCGASAHVCFGPIADMDPNIQKDRPAAAPGLLISTCLHTFRGDVAIQPA